MAGTRWSYYFIPATFRRRFRWVLNASYAGLMRTGTLGKAPQSVATADNECTLALVPRQSHGVIVHRIISQTNHIEEWCAASIQLARYGQSLLTY
jgi:hypothetical protein